ncbi:1-hydroxycarotenoid 3,4-desaturase CrtD [Rhodobaculum claviforme]|uniref:Methoxyneurosporene dehydrogenase n=1 Tax=Rhodobaculum claviforme TaxID=1549854 RepID=A0A934WJJ6_9RHOB|nr:1-hydroxycarotenoid 3,4-desaturase CrtD [Rhodobaculum claviforme]MBK5927929.1 methoxyneurosporene dehydrogenase [Rhodobaculum claviforme]
MTERIVVIGAGVGGLAAALRLAHAGCAVTVLERAATPGGKMRTLPSDAGPVDAGPTVMTMRWVFEDLFAATGERLDDHVTLHPEPLLARHWWPDGSTLDLFADPDASAAAIRTLAGARAEAEFRAFDAEAARLFAAFDAPMMRAPRPAFGRLAATVMGQPRLIAPLGPFATLARRLAGRFTDPRLRQLFGRYATYVGGSPDASPAVLSLIWHAEARGVWRVDGGMHRLAQAMAQLARARGAVFHHGADVARIEVRDGRATAAILGDGTRIAADRIVFNGDPAALHRGLLGAGVRRAVPRSAVAPRSLSAQVWAFAARPSRGDLAHHNVFFGADPAAEFGPIAAGRLPTDPTIYVCAQDRGAGQPLPDGPERFETIMNAPPHGASKGAGPCRMQECRDLTFATLARHGLSFDPPAPDRALTTPQGFDALFPGSDGSLYGRSPHGLTASLRRPVAATAVAGLYLAGGGAHPGAGIPMATLSGAHAAAAILNAPASTSASPRTDMPGGTSTPSPTAAPTRSPSSPS